MEDRALRPSLEDPRLLNGKDETVEEVAGVIRKEEENVMYLTAKKVLKRFWRHVIPKDQETQTESRVVDELREEISRLQLLL